MLFFKVLEKVFKVLYRDQTRIETSALPAMYILKRSNPIL